MVVVSAFGIILLTIASSLDKNLFRYLLSHQARHDFPHFGYRNGCSAGSDTTWRFLFRKGMLDIVLRHSEEAGLIQGRRPANAPYQPQTRARSHLKCYRKRRVVNIKARDSRSDRKRRVLARRCQIQKGAASTFDARPQTPTANAASWCHAEAICGLASNVLAARFWIWHLLASTRRLRSGTICINRNGHGKADAKTLFCKQLCGRTAA